MTELEKFKMCMAEAGFPQPNAYVRDADSGVFMPDADRDNEGCVRAIHRASLLLGDDHLSQWCADHYVEFMSNWERKRLPDACSCRG